MALYLPDFDKTLGSVSHDEAVPLQEQLVYAVLTEPRVLISAASPFKNLAGWQALERYSDFVTSGVVQFPLDQKHGGYADHYIQSRIRKISAESDTAAANPEIIGYTSREAEDIMNLISHPRCAAPRPRDCDLEFRTLVAADARSDGAETINGILHSKHLGWGQDEFIEFVAETATDKGKLFQRFHVIDHAPPTFIIDGVLRERLYHRLDELFFLANARAAGAANAVGSTHFVHTTAARVRAFAKGYVLEQMSLHGLLMALSSSSVLVLRESAELAYFLRSMSKWVTGTSEQLIMRWATKQAAKDRMSPYLQRTLTSVTCVAVSELLGYVLTASLDLPFGIPAKLASFLVGLFPQLAVKIKQTDARRLFEFARDHPKLNTLSSMAACT